MNGRNRWWLGGCLAALLCAAGGLRAADKADGEVTLRVTTPQEFQQVVRQQKGKVVLVDFWATWCVPCVKQFPHTVEWHRELADDGLAVISVSMDEPDDKDRALQFLKKQKATFTNLLSSRGGDEDAMQAFQIEGGAVPHYKLYGRDGRLLKTFGADPDKPWTHADVDKAVRAALKK